VRFLDQIDRGAIEEMLGRDEYFWLDLDAPSDTDVATLDDLFHWHPLAMEDLRKKGQRPKLEDYDQYMFLVYYGAAAPEGGEPPAPDAPVAAAPARGERVDLEEVHAFISGSYLVTVHDGECTALDEVRKRLDQQPPSSEQFVVYRVLDEQLIDVDGRRCGRVDDLEFDETVRAAPRLHAILSGSGTWHRRLPRARVSQTQQHFPPYPHGSYIRYSPHPMRNLEPRHI